MGALSWTQPKSKLNRKEFDAHARLLLPVLLAINLVFAVRCMTYIPNLWKIGQKLRSLRWMIAISDRQTYTQEILYPPNAMHCTGQTINFSTQHRCNQEQAHR